MSCLSGWTALVKAWVEADVRRLWYVFHEGPIFRLQKFTASIAPRVAGVNCLLSRLQVLAPSLHKRLPAIYIVEDMQGWM